MKDLPEWTEVHSIFFDFDGVFTDNRVNVSEEGVNMSHVQGEMSWE